MPERVCKPIRRRYTAQVADGTRSVPATLVAAAGRSWKRQAIRLRVPCLAPCRSSGGHGWASAAQFA
jgi:hypothetical protein